MDANTMTPATTNNSNEQQQGIVASWTLLAFAKAYGPKMQVGIFANKKTGEQFRTCIFSNPDGQLTFARFSKNLGELTPKEIAAQRNDLQIVQLQSGHFSLCKQGSTWDDVDLGL